MTLTQPMSIFTVQFLVDIPVKILNISTRHHIKFNTNAQALLLLFQFKGTYLHKYATQTDMRMSDMSICRCRHVQEA